MSETSYSIFQLLQDDPRYNLEAYQFIREALSYGQTLMEQGELPPAGAAQEAGGEDADEPDEPETSPSQGSSAGKEAGEPIERHLTGQQLCEAIRRYALQQYGYMAKTVLHSWGVKTTGDFGEIVFNLIRVGMMKKSKTDNKEDFDDQYDFDQAFCQEFQISLPE